MFKRYVHGGSAIDMQRIYGNCCMKITRYNIGIIWHIYLTKIIDELLKLWRLYILYELTQGHEINIISPALICVQFPVDKVSFLFKVKSWRTPTITFYNHPAICQFSNFGVQSDTKIISVNTCSGKIGMYESIYIAIFFFLFSIHIESYRQKGFDIE